ncbi:ATP-binding protein [Methanomicrobium antiquum]|uniref:ATP-binding protein n=1 Tax=Methanomicrobium antiquum TaxID=487686 RepID=A0AAF0FV72_9EURY|nr:ATP-binding protein [Methanomicrobium antiquum]WFN36545.1 ATP-binding protein [Methanomicrobium antiquum]
MQTEENLKIRPYARLLTMLGDQLIKNERVALVELVKNTYDADASWVTINFENFGDNYEILDDSKIIIEDNGEGMTADVIRNSWMNPATPCKLNKGGPARKSKLKSRTLQGEKGIGRFSALKLGKNVKIITRSRGSDEEYVVNFDFSSYDEDFISHNGEIKEIFLDDINISMATREPELIIEKDLRFGSQNIKRENHGTRIEISDLKGRWTEKRITSVYDDLAKLSPTFTKLFFKDKCEDDQFEIIINYNGSKWRDSKDDIEEFKNLIEYSPVLKIEDGNFNNELLEYKFKINGDPVKLELKSSEIRGLKVFNDHFKMNIGSENNKREVYRDPDCGSFNFAFYIFDLTNKKENVKSLDKEEKELIKKHRIYLFRDGIRVYPYGDPDDDWLEIDKVRGNIRASEMLSNDQTIGIIEISKNQNPNLNDKTNREGLIETGDATRDFIKLIQTLLSYIRKNRYQEYIDLKKNRREQEIYKRNFVQTELSSLKEHLSKSGDNEAIALLNQAEKNYTIEKNYLETRAEITEDLAGVGLAVETASHDIIAFLSKAIKAVDNLSGEVLHGNTDPEYLFDEISSVKGILSFIEGQFSDVQLLFRSSKKRRRNIRIDEMLKKVNKIYRKSLSEEKIALNIISTGSPLIAKTTDAVVLQLLINLFDNSFYWLKTIDIPDKEIRITLDGSQGKLIFSDNGPGISEEDKPYIFSSFYSGKGEEGRGLGLYIARQLLERHDYSIDLAELNSEEKLSGANFVVNFVAKGDEN